MRATRRHAPRGEREEIEKVTKTNQPFGYSCAVVQLLLAVLVRQILAGVIAPRLPFRPPFALQPHGGVREACTPRDLGVQRTRWRETSSRISAKRT